MKKIKFDKEEYNLEDKDAALILAIRELTTQLKIRNNK